MTYRYSQPFEDFEPDEPDPYEFGHTLDGRQVTVYYLVTSNRPLKLDVWAADAEGNDIDLTQDQQAECNAFALEHIKAQTGEQISGDDYPYFQVPF